MTKTTAELKTNDLMQEIIVDASHQILGRASSQIAKHLMKGAHVVVVNAQNAVISGKRDLIISEYRTRIQKGDPYHGPFYPKQPDLMFKRTVRGMLPKNARGRALLKNLRVYPGVPAVYTGKETIKFKNASSDKIIETQTTTLHSISDAIAKGKGRVKQ